MAADKLQFQFPSKHAETITQRGPATHRIITLSITINKKVTHHNVKSVVMLIVICHIMLSVAGDPFMQNFVVLKIFMQHVILLNAVLLMVVAPPISMLNTIFYVLSIYLLNKLCGWVGAHPPPI
jgi:hypothetical protein